MVRMAQLGAARGSADTRSDAELVIAVVDRDRGYGSTADADRKNVGDHTMSATVLATTTPAATTATATAT